MEREQIARLAALAREAARHPGQMVTGYDRSDIAHLRKKAAEAQQRADELKATADAAEGAV